MGYLQIGNKIITTPIETIIEDIRKATDNKFFSMTETKKDDLIVQCCFHKDGHESHPSLFICNNSDRDEYGVYHCFTCGATGTIADIVNFCFEESGDFGKRWLVEKYGEILATSAKMLPPLEMPKKEVRKDFLDESILEQYSYFHPYMFQRHLTEEVIRKFRIGYDMQADAITFPVWDEKGRLVSITRRSVGKKKFMLEAEVDKPVYLLNHIIKENIKTVYVCESQINALTLWTWGYPAVALFGTGSKYQYELLAKSGIRNYVLCFDGDTAGDKGTNRFMKFFEYKPVMISTKVIPRGTDVNDLTKKEFDKLVIK